MEEKRRVEITKEQRESAIIVGFLLLIALAVLVLGCLGIFGHGPWR